MSRPLVEWRRRPFRYAAIVCSIAVIALLMSGQGTESLLAITAGLIVLVVCWSLVLTRSASDTVILVGTGPELAIVAGILEGERQPLDRIFRASSIDMAADLATHHRCAAVIAALPNLPQKLELVDRTGQAVPIKPASEALAQMLRRIPLDIAAADPNFARSIETSRSQGYLIAKAIVERTIAALILAVLALPAAICAGALLVESRRSLITPIPYIGLRGRPFPMRRFRTKTDGGARSTRLGHVLTRTHAELVPSLLDVIRGDLALIGPRPDREQEAAVKREALPLYDLRTVAKPGLASWAQVWFRYTDAIRDTRLALEYDLFYAKHASLRLDLQIFARAMWLLTKESLDSCLAGCSCIGRYTVECLDAVTKLLPSRSPRFASVAMPESAASTTALKATLIAGAGQGGRMFARELRRNRTWGYWPVGFVDDDPAKIGTKIDKLPVLGGTDSLATLVTREHAEAVIIAIPSAPELTIARIANAARESSARVLTMPNLSDVLSGKSTALTLQTVRPTDVLGRPVVTPDSDRCRAFVAGKRVLVTGAAGSIGRELARQVALLGPSELFGLDINESDLYDLQQELRVTPDSAPFTPLVASISNRQRIATLFAKYKPDIVFHAAAYKHVPLMEDHPNEAVFANTVGTYDLATAAAHAGVERFVLVSTDKAVRPSSVMGATKRLAELAVRGIAEDTGMSACAVRFGNVLGSRGSVLPLFEKQISAGGPVTVTHPDMLRYFMTIPEAASLIIEAGAFGDRGVIYMLDMGEEVSIRELAERLIRLRGLRVGHDIKIEYSGLRPGEKLREELALDFEHAHETLHAKIRILAETPTAAAHREPIARVITRLCGVAQNGLPADVRNALLCEIADIDFPAKRNDLAGFRATASVA
ncbi:MAG: polysaccharide biosynthesis protein [Thermomicrobiales bacterium]